MQTEGDGSPLHVHPENAALSKSIVCRCPEVAECSIAETLSHTPCVCFDECKTVQSAGDTFEFLDAVAEVYAEVSLDVGLYVGVPRKFPEIGYTCMGRGRGHKRCKAKAAGSDVLTDVVSDTQVESVQVPVPVYL